MSEKKDKKVVLMILDGFGIGNKTASDCVFNANTPNLDSLISRYPNSQLLTHGNNVGLPDGQMGNSEVGHINIGAGRIVYQDLVRINMDIENDNISNNEQLKKAFSYARDNNKSLHFIGLVSDGGVHSMDTHLYKLCEIATRYNVKNTFVHAITDGRDTDPKSGLGFIAELLENLKDSNAKIASVIGRYYSMDRDKRWERIKKGYDLYVHGTGAKTKDILGSIADSYEKGITDEFIEPIVVVNELNEPVAKISDGDVVICFNYRTDRLRQLTIALTQNDFPDFNMKSIPLEYYTLTNYDDSFRNINVIYDKDNLANTIGEIVSNVDKKQIRIAETEKYAHVTFFFSGGREKEFKNERRIMIPSPKVATYDLQPEMSAFLVKDALVSEINKADADFIVVNFANCDMVGHTGIYDAIIKAVETVDKCVGEVVNAAISNNYEVIIIADHGNADYTINPDGTPNTAHSLNPVPCILISDRYKHINDGILADLAPTILTLMGIKIPSIMTGKILM